MGFSEEDLKKLRAGPGVRAVHDPADMPGKEPVTPTKSGKGKHGPPTQRPSDQDNPALSSSGTQYKEKTTHARDRMNYTEQRYEDEFLWPLYYDGLVSDWLFETVKFRLEEKCYYTPDFFVVRTDGSFEISEVKGGFAREDAIVKFKSAVALFPWFRWIWAQYKKKQWSVTAYT